MPYLFVHSLNICNGYIPVGHGGRFKLDVLLVDDCPAPLQLDALQGHDSGQITLQKEILFTIEEE